jgi:hypothetical protein
MSRKFCGNILSQLIVKYRPSNFLEGLKKIVKHVSESPAQGIKPGNFEYKAGVLITKSRPWITRDGD